MRRVEHLILHVRRASENERQGTGEGISDEEFIQWLNDAQDMIYSKITRKHRMSFAKETTFAATGAESYTSLPFDIYSRHRIIALDYSETGSEASYRSLTPMTHQERTLRGSSSLPNVASGYVPTQNGIIVVGAPSVGTFRLVYEPILPRLDKRRGTVSTHTKSSTALTALTLTGHTAADFSEDDALTIVSATGQVNMRGIPYTAVAGGGAVTISGSSYTFPVGSTLTNGDFVCRGEYASTHSQLPDQCERYLIAYATWRAMKRDSSVDAGEQMNELAMIEDDIVSGFAQMSGDVEQVPIVDATYAWEV